MESSKNLSRPQIPWNKGKIVGQKPALKLKETGEFAFDFK